MNYRLVHFDSNMCLKIVKDTRYIPRQDEVIQINGKQYKVRNVLVNLDLLLNGECITVFVESY